jgi:hypothetical protein
VNKHITRPSPKDYNVDNPLQAERSSGYEKITTLSELRRSSTCNYYSKNNKEEMTEEKMRNKNLSHRDNMLIENRTTNGTPSCKDRMCNHIIRTVRTKGEGRSCFYRKVRPIRSSGKLLCGLSVSSCLQRIYSGLSLYQYTACYYHNHI